MEQVQQAIGNRSARQYADEYMNDLPSQTLPPREALTKYFQRCIDETLASAAGSSDFSADWTIVEMAKAILTTRAARHECPFCKRTSDCAPHCIVMEANRIIRKHDRASLEKLL